MTASSGPGISLMQEGLSYLAGAELPCVIVDVMRGGPGLGNIGPEQGDYNQMVKGGGHGNYRLIVYAPASAQEMCDLTMLAFALADRYRNPAIVLTDGFIGQMMEPVEFPAAAIAPADARLGGARRRRDAPEPDHLDLPGARGARAAQPQADGEVRRSRRRTLPEHRGYLLEDAEVLPRRLRHRLPRAALGRRPGAPRGDQGRALPPDHALALPGEGAGGGRGEGQALPRRRALRRPDGPGRAARGQRAAARSASTGARAAWCRRRRRVFEVLRGPGQGAPVQWQPAYSRPATFYKRFERKDGNQETTHYCPGCGHGHIHKYIAEALDDFGVAGPDDRHQPGRLLGLRLLLLRRRQRAGRARPLARRSPPASSARTRTRSSSATRATATSRRSAATRSSRPPTAARTTRSSSSTTRSTA